MDTICVDERRMSSMTRRLLSFSLLAALLAAGPAGCGGSSTSSSSSASTPSSTSGTPSTSAGVSTATLPKLGPVLVDAQGRTLYVFMPDRHARVTCTGSCAQVWPPLKLASGQAVKASGAVRPSLLGSASDPEGASVATYAGWPLYTYAGDSGPGTASGQGLNINGGLWYVIAPSGTIVTTAP
jgi:predicted lipoprotein with Yx(FWY)xxD motif